MALQRNELGASLAAYEDGELNAQEVTDLFALLVREGLAWRLQGTYGRVADAMIQAGYISAEGEVLLDWG